jgi:hypothetical protein
VAKFDGEKWTKMDNSICKIVNIVQNSPFLSIVKAKFLKHARPGKNASFLFLSAYRNFVFISFCFIPWHMRCIWRGSEDRHGSLDKLERSKKPELVGQWLRARQGSEG